MSPPTQARVHIITVVNAAWRGFHFPLLRSGTTVVGIAELGQWQYNTTSIVLSLPRDLVLEGDWRDLKLPCVQPGI